MQHSLKDNGIYHVSVYDWEDGFQWDTIPPAISYFIEVKKAPGNHNCYFCIKWGFTELLFPQLKLMTT